MRCRSHRLALVVVVTALSVASTGALARRPAHRLAQIAVVATPADVGLESPTGAVVEFDLVGQRRRSVRVDVEIGFDADGDGVIADGEDGTRPSEYVAARADVLDPRRTSSRRDAYRFEAVRGQTVSHRFVWSPLSSVGDRSLPAAGRVVVDLDGRPVADPDRPGDVLREAGEGGVRVRVRTRGRIRSGDRARTRRGPWVYSEPFSLDLRMPTRLSLDGATVGDVVFVEWSASHWASEDSNGNGTLEILDGEDTNLNGRLDAPNIVVAFDHAMVPDGFDVASASSDDLEGLLWTPSRRAQGEGDPIRDVLTSNRPRSYAFAWDWRDDGVVPGARVLIRARAHDGEKFTSFVYAPAALVLPR